MFCKQFLAYALLFYSDVCVPPDFDAFLDDRGDQMVPLVSTNY